MERKEDKEADPHTNPAHGHHEKFADLLSEMKVSIRKRITHPTVQGAPGTEQRTEVRIYVFTPAAATIIGGK